MFEHLASSHSTFFKNKFLTVEHQVEIERSERMIVEGVKRKKKCAVSCVSLNLNLILAAEFDHTKKLPASFKKIFLFVFFPSYLPVQSLPSSSSAARNSPNVE